MKNFANKPESDKQAYFELAADKKGLSKEIIEKDFWVCWTLQQLFLLPEIGNHLIFKGGTSLSKAYKIIERFSEDIDISVDKKYLGFVNDLDPEIALSKKKQQTLIKNLSDACKCFVQTHLIDQLNNKFSATLDSVSAPWKIEIDLSDPDGQSILFYYPTVEKNNVNAYIRPAIKIELGARGADNPINFCTIIPFIEELIPGTLIHQDIQIKTLAAERTFWEKATILHMYSHWPENKRLPERQSRHFFDLYKLLQSDIKISAMNDPELLKRVSEHKNIYFRAAWAEYNNAIKGKLSLIPNSQVLKNFENDYRKMQEMFYGDPIKWDSIINDIAKFEDLFNSCN